MSETKFTPGPWVADMRGNQSPASIDSIERFGIAAVGEPGQLSEEDRANARLITAAPELFEACSEALDFIKQIDEFRLDKLRVLKALTAALSKARGEQ